uniref:Putative secreted protein n=1 Tax=Anopheles darlingi TaxID=43151 RepID=A0A2M4D3B2_ANODA
MFWAPFFLAFVFTPPFFIRTTPVPIELDSYSRSQTKVFLSFLSCLPLFPPCFPFVCCRNHADTECEATPFC